MAEENQAQQVTKEPQQVTKEPQRVTTKDPKKVEAGKRLAANQSQKKRSKEERRTSTIGEDWSKPILRHWSCSSCGGDRWSWLLHLSNQETTIITKNDLILNSTPENRL